MSCGTQKYLSIFFCAGERLRNQRLPHAGERLRDQRLSYHQSSPACHAQTAGITFQLSQLRAVGGVSVLTWHSRGRRLVLRRQLNSNFLTNSNSLFIVFPLLTSRRPCGDTPFGDAVTFLIQPSFNQHNLRLRHPRHGQSSFTAAASNPNRS